jgi:3-phosphoglycerate kinase
MQLKTFQISKIKKGTRVLMRVDCDVPLKNRIVDDASAWRLEQTLEDIIELRKRGAIIILLGHLGRPNGQVKLSLSLKPIARWYEKRLGVKVEFVRDPTCDSAFDKMKYLESESVLMIENLRFWKGEENNSTKFAKQLARFGDLYINNAFGVSHRKHASVHAITKLLPSYAGSILVNEVKRLSDARKHPFVFVLGGVKLETKIPTLMNLGKDADTILVGGAVAIAMISIDQKKILYVDENKLSRKDLSLAKLALKKFKSKIILPVDYICCRDKKIKIIQASNLETSDSIIDIGPSTNRLFSSSIKSAKCVVFNGAMGLLEKNSQEGTIAIAKAVNTKQQSIVGGGDTVGFLQSKKLLNNFEFVSTGGGAVLTFLAGERMPGVEVLKIK